MHFFYSLSRVSKMALSVTGPVFSFYRDFPGILIVLILKTSGMGKWYSWDFDCLISVRHLIV